MKWGDILRKVEDYIGTKYWDLTVIGADTQKISQTINCNHWLFKCKCGKTISELPSRVLSGHKKSCGCRKSSANVKHGMYNNPLYHGWWSMMQRCYNPSHHNYQRYGGRGIKVCEDWHTIEGFLAWANNSYDSTCDGKTLDRIDNNGNYEPGNCRWATPKEQMNNRRNTSKFTINGVTKPLSEWCDDYHMPLQVVSARIRCLEWDVLKSLTTPVMRFDAK